MPQETKSHGDEQDPQGLTKGSIVTPDDPEVFRKALLFVTDYRGDVSVTLTDGTVIEGFVFDVESAEDPQQSALRIMPKAGGGRQRVSIADVAQLEISGRDMAAGKSFDTWIRKYVEKKIQGEAANIECESLDDSA